jgi:hypothetical protein
VNPYLSLWRALLLARLVGRQANGGHKKREQAAIGSLSGNNYMNTFLYKAMAAMAARIGAATGTQA